MSPFLNKLHILTLIFEGEREKDVRNSRIFEYEFIFFFVPHHVDSLYLHPRMKLLLKMKIQTSKMMLKVKIL